MSDQILGIYGNDRDEIPELFAGMMSWLYEEISDIDKQIAQDEEIAPGRLKMLYARAIAFREVIAYWVEK